MTQSKSKSSSKSKSKKPAATSKKVKVTTAAKSVVRAPEPRVTAPMPEPTLTPVREVSRAEFMELVRKEAYRRATRREFKNGSAFQDWVNAEAAVSGKLAASGARLS